MIDELELIRRMRPEAQEPQPIVVRRARRAVLRTALAPRRSRRTGRIAAVVVASAAALAVAFGALTPGGGGAPARATALAAEHLAAHPEVGADEYLHIKRVERMWGNGGAGVVNPWTLEYWIPGDRTSDWIERSGDPGKLEDNEFNEWGPKLYVDHATEPAALLEQLRDYADANEAGNGPHGLWTVGFWIANDPVAPQSFKDEVMNALASAEGVTVADNAFEAGDLSGKAITIDEPYPVWFILDPATNAFRGMAGHMEKDETWVGPEEPMWTITFETDVVSSAP